MSGLPHSVWRTDVAFAGAVLMQTKVFSQQPDGSWNPQKTYPNPLLAFIAARKLSRRAQLPCRTVCINGQVLEEILPA